MDTTLQNSTIVCYKTVYTSTLTAEETGETVVPDKMPDIGMIANTGAGVLLRSKEAADGSLTLQGEILVSVVYLPDGECGLRALNLSLPCTVSFESPEITQDCVPEGCMRVSNVETRMLNPRKILVKAEVTTEVTCYARQEERYCTGLAERERFPVQLRRTGAKFHAVAAVCERTFVVTDEYPLPAAAGTCGDVVRRSAQFRVEDVKTISNKLIVKGTVLSEVLYATTDGGMETASFPTVFSQIIETDSEEISGDARITIMPTGMYYELVETEAGPKITMELHAVCQAAAMSQHEVEFVSDAFSNRCACGVEYQALPVLAQTRGSVQRETVRENIPGKAAVASVRFAVCNVGRITVNGGTVCVRVDAAVCVCYENGAEDCLSKRMEVNFSTDADSASQLRVENVRCTDVYSIPSGNGVELRFTVEADLRTETQEVLRSVCAIQLDEECPCDADRPSLTVVRTGGALWDVARKYGSTVELIRSMNELEEETVPAGSVLFVPRERF